MIDLGAYKEKFAESGLRIFQRAVDEARRRNQNYVSIGHIIQAVALEDAAAFGGFLENLRVLHTSKSGLASLVEMKIEELVESSPRYEGHGVRLDPGTIKLLKRALRKAREQGRERIEAVDLIQLFTYKPYVRSNQTSRFE